MRVREYVLPTFENVLCVSNDVFFSAFIEFGLFMRSFFMFLILLIKLQFVLYVLVYKKYTIDTIKKITAMMIYKFILIYM